MEWNRGCQGNEGISIGSKTLFLTLPVVLIFRIVGHRLWFAAAMPIRTIGVEVHDRVKMGNPNATIAQLHKIMDFVEPNGWKLH